MGFAPIGLPERARSRRDRPERSDGASVDFLDLVGNARTGSTGGGAELRQARSSASASVSSFLAKQKRAMRCSKPPW